jgi:transcriptional regulator with XRE-family HTH domain
VPADKIRQSVCSQVARVLREKREERGLSMRELAHQAGLSQAMISFVEHELRNPTLDTLLRMANVLKVDLSDVLRQAQKAQAPNRKPK